MVRAVCVEDMPRGPCSLGRGHATWSVQFRWRTCHVVRAVCVEDMPRGLCSLGKGHATWSVQFRWRTGKGIIMCS